MHCDSEAPCAHPVDRPQPPMHRGSAGMVTGILIDIVRLCSNEPLKGDCRSGRRLFPKGDESLQVKRGSRSQFAGSVTPTSVSTAWKVRRELDRQGHAVARCTVELMLEHGIAGAVHGKRVITTIAHASEARPGGAKTVLCRRLHRRTVARRVPNRSAKADPGAPAASRPGCQSSLRAASSPTSARRPNSSDASGSARTLR